MLNEVPAPVKEAIQAKLAPAVLKDFTYVSGGCINNGGKLRTSDNMYFVKWNDRAAFPSMFITEDRGLRLLESSHSLRVNRVFDVGQIDHFQYIVLEWIQSEKKCNDFWTRLGQGLAQLHRNTAPSFGLDHDNYIGSLTQLNTPSQSWADFFIHQRLEPQIKLATDNHHPVDSLRKKLETLYGKISALMPVEAPSLLHGDLWSGNLIADENGQPSIIDPAVYYGHREAELAFARLMSNFDREFYRSYEEAFPLSEGFNDRADLYNLYPLLVHINLFGGDYIRRSEDVVNRFV